MCEDKPTSEVERGMVTRHVRAPGGTPVVIRIVVCRPARTSIRNPVIGIIDKSGESDRQNTEQRDKKPPGHPTRRHRESGGRLTGDIAKRQRSSKAI